MNNNNAKTLIHHLEQEINWIEALNLLLSEERDVLSESQFDQLEPLADKKQALSTLLEESAKHRSELLAEINKSASPSESLHSFLKNCTTEEANRINKLNELLVERLSTCRELNAINGQIITSNIHTRQQIVSILSGNNADSISVYTATGNLKSSSDTNHHQKA